MNNAFDTTAWMIETMLVMIAMMAAVPLLRGVLGLLLVVADVGLGRRRGRLHRAGVAVMPAFLRSALGLTAGLSMLAGPAMAAEPVKSPAIEQTIVIDRIVEIGDAVGESAPVAEKQKEVARPEVAKPEVAKPVSANRPLSPVAAEYVVQKGDSLWSIARHELQRSIKNPTNQQIDNAWRTLWKQNLDELGTDPSLIFPGQRLQIPADLAK